MDEPVEEPSGTTTESAAKVNNMSASAVENKSELITSAAAEVYPVESRKDWCCFQSCCRTNTNSTRAEQMTGAGAMESRSPLLVPSHLMEQQQTSGYISNGLYL